MDIQLLEHTDTCIRERYYPEGAEVALILGSGWSAIGEAFDCEAKIPYHALPAMGETAIAGHTSQLIVARAGQRRVLIFQGRHHWYEGAGWTPIACPVFMAVRAGVQALLITNAAGGIRDDLQPGDAMLVTDHINAMGANPLCGPHHTVWGERFPNQNLLYDPALNDQLRQSAQETTQSLREGVYLATSGPCYETPAEIRGFRTLGADAVGMSTVPEAILAGAAGLRTAAVAFIANRAAGMEQEAPRHTSVLEALAAGMPTLQPWIHHAVTHFSL